MAQRTAQTEANKLTPPMPSSPLPAAQFHTLRVSAKAEIAQGIYQFDLCSEGGAALPSFTPGAHLTVQTPSGEWRDYSLCNLAGANGADCYQIALKHDPQGRGGSRSMVDQLALGAAVLTSAPRNHFALVPWARQLVLIAGGIGITPIMAMVRHLRHLRQRGDTPFRLIYCTRDAASTAFLAELNQAAPADQVHIHHDGGDAARAYDFWPLFERPSSDTHGPNAGAHVYCCGPQALMDSVRDMTGHWPSGSVHFESFAAAPAPKAGDQAFTVRLARSAKRIEVGAEQSILMALRQAGVLVPSSCESGTCGTCRTGLLSGRVDHRDFVLMDDEQASQIMLCVSRASRLERQGDPLTELVLDL